MATEIERKYKIEKLPEGLTIVGVQNITQNYLAVGEEEVRIRKKITNYLELEQTLCIKRGRGLVREEITHELDGQTYRQLANSLKAVPIVKNRLLIEHGEQIIEVDKYTYESLVIAEVEFNSEEAANQFKAPDWFGEEVTMDPLYKNQSIWKELQKSNYLEDTNI